MKYDFGLGSSDAEYDDLGNTKDVKAAWREVTEADSVTGMLKQSIDLVGAILTVVVAGAVAYAGLAVMSEIDSSLSLSANSAFSNASTQLQNGVETFFTQLPTVFIVIALVVVIGYLTILRR